MTTSSPENNPQTTHFDDNDQSHSLCSHVYCLLLTSLPEQERVMFPRSSFGEKAKNSWNRWIYEQFWRTKRETSSRNKLPSRSQFSLLLWVSSRDSSSMSVRGCEKGPTAIFAFSANRTRDCRKNKMHKWNRLKIFYCFRIFILVFVEDNLELKIKLYLMTYQKEDGIMLNDVGGHCVQPDLHLVSEVDNWVSDHWIHWTWTKNKRLKQIMTTTVIN